MKSQSTPENEAPESKHSNTLPSISRFFKGWTSPSSSPPYAKSLLYGGNFLNMNPCQGDGVRRMKKEPKLFPAHCTSQRSCQPEARRLFQRKYAKISCSSRDKTRSRILADSAQHTEYIAQHLLSERIYPQAQQPERCGPTG